MCVCVCVYREGGGGGFIGGFGAVALYSGGWEGGGLLLPYAAPYGCLHACPAAAAAARRPRRPPAGAALRRLHPPSFLTSSAQHTRRLVVAGDADVGWQLRGAAPVLDATAVFEPLLAAPPLLAHAARTLVLCVPGLWTDLEVLAAGYFRTHVAYMQECGFACEVAP